MEDQPRIGRPTKWTPELQERVIEGILAGNYIQTVCEANGISRQIFYDWLRRGDEGEEPYVNFFEACQIAFSRAEMGLLEKVKTTDGPFWQRFSWILERTRHARFGQRQQIEVTQDVTVTQLSLPASAPDFASWLSQVVAAERELGRLRPEIDLGAVEDAEIVSNAETLERVEVDIQRLRREGK
ncbi:MAG: hypothetical protein A3F84_25135 [Candidatus Handelsmanbacteria bacterium RIFCSPLOWO2_12_FULL_64_10]|uniref:Homeodomain phBC6A51-type domain-containing protein n=1 Tax=Handelsmanbacteria sp. (strain RIFCSPLOWO2_12_FULL_64_10) TaxID=1817868 RepID=A0A1F6CBR9_HANXR|nr:MAG: hypothetical protein A3F84_25135 [Candidatus Handelsmanbacteria bacterium RIFCSPLOWO2_12_FULL_64_10]